MSPALMQAIWFVERMAVGNEDLNRDDRIDLMTNLLALNNDETLQIVLLDKLLRMPHHIQIQVVHAAQTGGDEAVNRVLEAYYGPASQDSPGGDSGSG